MLESVAHDKVGARLAMTDHGFDAGAPIAPCFFQELAEKGNRLSFR